MLEPIVRTIEVPCNQKEAFTVFVNDMATWWPLHKFSVSAKSGKEPKALHVEAKLGGQIIELGHDGCQHLWGTFTTFEPYETFCMDFHIAEPEASASLVEVAFKKLEEQRTQVKLVQSNWDGFGKKATWMHAGYELGWGTIFEQCYKDACQP